MALNLITKEQKEEVLKRRGHKKLVGWAMEYSAPESDNIIITEEEMRKYIDKPTEEWWLDKWGECAYNLDDIWQEVYDEHDDTEDEQVVYEREMAKEPAQEE